VKSLALPSRVPRPATVSAVLTDLIERHGAESEAQVARESASLYHRAKYGQVAWKGVLPAYLCREPGQ